MANQESVVNMLVEITTPLDPVRLALTTEEMMVLARLLAAKMEVSHTPRMVLVLDFLMTKIVVPEIVISPTLT